MIPDDIAERLAKGEEPINDPVGTNYQEACRQSCEIVRTQDSIGPALVKLIMKIQEQQKAIEMFEYNQGWRKRRP